MKNYAATLVKTGRYMFAAGIIFLGILCFIYRDFIPGRPPAWSKDFKDNSVLAYTGGIIIIACSLAILANKKAAASALVIAVVLLVLSVARHLTYLTNDWLSLNSYKSLALFGGAGIIMCSYFKPGGNDNPWFIPDSKVVHGFVWTGCILMAAFFIIGGYSHFRYAAFVNQFIPAYIPFRPFWTYACGICLGAGGVGLLIPATRKWAALLSGIMIGGWFLLLHIPRFIANMNDASDRMGLGESFAFAGICFCIAGISRKGKGAPGSMSKWP